MCFGIVTVDINLVGSLDHQDSVSCPLKPPEWTINGHIGFLNPTLAYLLLRQRSPQDLDLCLRLVERQDKLNASLSVRLCHRDSG